MSKFPGRPQSRCSGGKHTPYLLQTTNRKVIENRKLPVLPANVHRDNKWQTVDLSSVAMDWAEAFYGRYRVVLPKMLTRLDLEEFFVCWATHPDFAPPKLFSRQCQFRQVLFAMRHHLEVCKIKKDGTVEWMFPDITA